MRKEVRILEHTNEFLEKEPVGKLMRMYSVPCIISLLVAALYNIVDQIFIANASYLGSYGNAANTVVFPLTIVALAVAVMIGDGACAHVSILLGMKKSDDAASTVGNAVILTIVSSLIITALYLGFSRAILTMFGGTVNEETYRQASEYFFWITVGIPFYMFGQTMNPIIRSDGSPRFAMVSTLVGALFNIIFDPILIFGLKWGMMGAAVATIAGQIITFLSYALGSDQKIPSSDFLRLGWSPVLHACFGRADIHHCSVRYYPDTEGTVCPAGYVKMQVFTPASPSRKVS